MITFSKTWNLLIISYRRLFALLIWLLLLPISSLKELVEKNRLRRWRAEQIRLKLKLITCDTEAWQESFFSSPSTSPGEPRLRLVGGVDVSFADDGVSACASIVVCDFPDLNHVYSDFLPFKLNVPYIPGFLAFREVEPLFKLWQNLKKKRPDFLPDVVLLDGNGVLHPHGFGSACHFGVIIDNPTIGVAKKLYHVDGIEKSPEHKNKIRAKLRGKGDAFELVGNSGVPVGAALRTADDASNPVYVSVGHRISLRTAIEVTKRCSVYRVPEPIRQADIRSREYLRKR